MSPPGTYSFWSTTARPAVAADADAVPVELGMRFTTNTAGAVRGVRYYKSTTNTGTHTGSLWDSAGHRLATGTFVNETASGWQELTFRAPVTLTPAKIYVVSYHTSTGHYARDNDYFTARRSSGPLSAPGARNGVYAYGAGGFPTQTYRATNYWVDVRFVVPASSGTPTATSKPTTSTPTPTPTPTKTATPTATSSPPSAGGLSVRVAGNRLVDSAGKPLTLRGANVAGTEFTCAQNWTDDAYGGQPLSATSTFATIRSWKQNVVRIPLNEDCWLGINGVQVGGTSYRNAIAAEVKAAHAAGLITILDLHWTAPGGQRALSQNPAPDADHSATFWSQVATAYKSDPAVIFDLFNEPYDYWGTNSDRWAGWLNGTTQTQYITGGSPYSVNANWKTAGMQQLVDTVRATGATQPILVNGTDWANDLSGWLAHKPNDPLNQIIAGWHSYPGQPCGVQSCWDSVIAPIAAKYPVLVGETGDSATGTQTYLPKFLPWADAHGLNYLAWTWNPWGDGYNVMIKDWNGTPTAGEGTFWKNYLATVVK